jgi:adenylate cyclase
MPVEIERKFLVTHDGWRRPDPGQRYYQGYLCTGEVTVRVRCAASRGFLTIKGSSNGSVRPEFEYEIPVNEAEELLNLCHHPLIEKVRHEVLHSGMVWHVDEFAGENTGLVLAEIELSHPRQAVELPDWIGEEVTSDERYRNSRLANAPRGAAGVGSPAAPSSLKRAERAYCRSDTSIGETCSDHDKVTGQGETGGAPASGKWKDSQEEVGAP